MKISHLDECTTAGAVATVAQPFSAVQKRAPAAKAKGSNLLKGIKTSAKYVNSLHESVDEPTLYDDALSFFQRCSDEQLHSDQNRLVAHYLKQRGRGRLDNASMGIIFDALYHVQDEMMEPVDESTGDEGIYMGARVYHKEHQSGEPFKVIKIVDDQRVGVIDDYGNKKVMFINQLVPAQQGHTEEHTDTEDGRNHANAFGTYRYESVEEAQSLGGALNNALSKVEPGSKLDQKIKTHNRQVKSGVKDKQFMMTSPPEGYHFKKDGSVALGEGAIGKAIKSVKRGMQGWGGDLSITGNENKPKDVVKRNKGYDDATLSSMDRAIKTPLGFPFGGGKQSKHSPAALQKRVVDREMKKRGLGEQGVTEGLKFHGGFPDVDHMPGAVYRNGERPPGMSAPVGPPANYRNKAEWARAANRINSEAHDDNAEIISGQGVTKYMHDGKCFAKWVDSKNAGVTAGQPLSEAEISENDIVLAPGKGRQYKPGLLTKPEVSVNPTDTVKLDIPLLIRLLEFAKEDAADDMDLHDLAEKLVAGCARGKTLTMRDYDSLVPEVAPKEPEQEMNEISTDTVNGYLKGAMHDTITGKKDRNPGMKRAISRLSGTDKPLISAKTGQVR